MNGIDALTNPLLRDIADTQQQREAEAQANKQELGQDAFLRLMIAQLNNQNPLNPQENGEFISQLAQFSSVEGITNVNNSINTLVDEVRSGRTIEASSLIGKTVEVQSDSARLVEGEGIAGSFVLGASSPSVTLQISDAFGSLVYSENLGSRPAGEHRFAWDGIGSGGRVIPSGDYRVSLTGLENGESVQLAVQTADVVEGLYLDANSNVILNLASGRSVPVEDIQRLSQAPNSSESQNFSQALDSLVGQFQSSRALEASALVGRSVEYQGGLIQHQANGAVVDARVNVPAGGEAVFGVFNSNGQQVYSQTINGSGEQSVSWNGVDQQGVAVAPGEYQMRVVQAGDTLPLRFTGHVNSVSLGNASSGTALNIDGVGTIPIDQVVRVL